MKKISLRVSLPLFIIGLLGLFLAISGTVELGLAIRRLLDSMMPSGPARAMVEIVDSPLGVFLFACSFILLSRLVPVSFGNESVCVGEGEFSYSEVKLRGQFGGFVALNVRGLAVFGYVPPGEARASLSKLAATK